jgi:hypothetical protein
MNAFSTAELTNMQDTQESAMMDTCVLLRYSDSVDALNHPVPTWTDGLASACGLDMRGGEERTGDGRVIVKWEAMLRLPINTTLDLWDRIRITTRFGVLLNETIVYQIVSPVQQGPSGLRIRLQKVEPSE